MLWEFMEETANLEEVSQKGHNSGGTMTTLGQWYMNRERKREL